MPWTVRFEDTFERDFLELEDEVREAILAAARLLEDYGPQLGRPHADTLEGSHYANMKELGFAAADGIWRVAFAFDPRRHGILLVAGDKSGVSEKRFYRGLVARADKRYAAHLERLRTARTKERIAGMGRTLREMLDTLPKASRARVDGRYRHLKAEVEGLRALRKVAGKAQADIATALHIKQPSVSKIEKQADMYISTLRGYVEAIGGELELIVRLPSHPAMRLHHLGDVFDAPPPAARSRSLRSATTKRINART